MQMKKPIYNLFIIREFEKFTLQHYVINMSLTRKGFVYKQNTIETVKK